MNSIRNLPARKNFKVTTQIAHIAKAPQANTEVKALSKSATHGREHTDNFENIKPVSIFAKVHYGFAINFVSKLKHEISIHKTYRIP